MDKEPLLAVAVLTELEKRVKAARESRREEAAAMLDRGDSITVSSPLTGAKLGKVSLSDPKPTAKVRDQRALDEWIAEEYPENTDHHEVITDHTAAIDVLKRHAPHLVACKHTVPEWARNEIVQLSEQAGAPVGPGGELDPPGVEVTVRPGWVSFRGATDAGPEIARIVQAGLVDLTDGTVRELPRGEAA